MEINTTKGKTEFVRRGDDESNLQWKETSQEMTEWDRERKKSVRGAGGEEQ